MDADPSKAFAEPVSETGAGEVIDMNPINAHRFALRGARLDDALLNGMSNRLY